MFAVEPTITEFLILIIAGIITEVLLVGLRHIYVAITTTTNVRIEQPRARIPVTK